MASETLQDALNARRRHVDEALAGCFNEVAPARLRDATRWYPDAGGKRLRPIMALLACEAAGGTARSALPVALAVELIHNFSLVHDDIMDRDATRRGRDTVHVKWDEATAILAGDVLFARAFEVLADIPDAQSHREASQLLSRAIRKLCEGQALDVMFESRDDVQVDEYLEMIRGKTALLFEAACRGGALCANPERRPDEPAGSAKVAAPAHAEKHADALARFGEAFGMAFQVADDLLDVTAASSAMGKPWGSDLRGGKRTILVLDCLEHGDEPQKRVLRAALGSLDASDETVRGAVEAIRASGALRRAEALRDRYAKEAEQALSALPPSDARAHLGALNEWARTRGH